MLEKSRRSVLASIGGIAALSTGVGSVGAAGSASENDPVPIDTSGLEGVDEAFMHVANDKRVVVVRGSVSPAQRSDAAPSRVFSVDFPETTATGGADPAVPSISRVETTSVLTTNGSTTQTTTTGTGTEQVTTSGNSPSQGSDSGTDPTNNYEGGAFVTHHNLHGTDTLAKSEQHISWEQTNGEVDWIWRGHQNSTGLQVSGSTEFNGLDWSGDTVVSRVAGNYTQSPGSISIDHRVNLTGNPNGAMGWETIWWSDYSDSSTVGYNTGFFNENQMR